ncbi:hypothetical protein [Acidicapsa acidisoli]|uniref:hypothetical protein n=1 Tax=Acidicapsa acidisoli TaxID=1615681 RepID=UPI0021DF7E53|nr:hypothetical protein [Acidicapsa acidisoli]
MMQTESFSNSLYTDQMHLTERELSAFIAAVGASHGPEEAVLAAEDWIEESELMDSSLRSEVRNWGAVTIAASVRLANRLTVALRGQKPLGPATTGTEVSPIAANVDYTDNHAIFEQVHEDRIR